LTRDTLSGKRLSDTEGGIEMSKKQLKEDLWVVGVSLSYLVAMGLWAWVLRGGL
jgi:hypothetical protein